MCLIILTIYVSLEVVRSFEMSGYDYSMRYSDILEESNDHISSYPYIYEGESNENLKYVLSRNLLNTKGTQ